MFYVGVGIGPFVGGGKLTIAPGAIVLEPDRLTRSLIRVSRIVHTDRQVTLVKARLVPPWFSTSLVLHDRDASGYAATWLGARHRLRASLKDAGFDVQEIRTWFSLTGGGAASSRVRRTRPKGARTGDFCRSSERAARGQPIRGVHSIRRSVHSTFARVALPTLRNARRTPRRNSSTSEATVTGSSASAALRARAGPSAPRTCSPGGLQPAALIGLDRGGGDL